MAKNWYYEKYNPETGEIKRCPVNDLDGSVTGKIVIGVKTWFDEHPEERIARGWIKHIMGNIGEIDYNPQTQYLISTTQVIDEYTVEDVYMVMEKTEDMLLLEELAAGVNGMFVSDGPGVIFVGGQNDE